jgi:hypothetical protein
MPCFSFSLWPKPGIPYKCIILDFPFSNTLSFGSENMIAIARVLRNCLFQMFQARIGSSQGLKIVSLRVWDNIPGNICDYTREMMRAVRASSS